MKRFLAFLLCLTLGLSTAPVQAAVESPDENPASFTSRSPEGFEHVVPVYSKTGVSTSAASDSVIRVYKDYNAWWGENRDHHSILALGKVQDQDYFVHPSSELASGIPADTDVVLITSNSDFSGYYENTRDNVNSPQAQAALDEFVRGGGVLVIDMGDNDEHGGYHAPGSVGTPDLILSGSYSGSTCRDATLMPGAFGPDGLLGTDDDHPMVKGPDGIAGTADDLNDGNIDIEASCHVAHGNLVDGITLPENTTYLMSAMFGPDLQQKPILAEYPHGAGWVILDTNTKEFSAQYPYYEGPARFLTNLLSYALTLEPSGYCASPDPGEGPLPELPDDPLLSDPAFQVDPSEITPEQWAEIEASSEKILQQIRPSGGVSASAGGGEGDFPDICYLKQTVYFNGEPFELVKHQVIEIDGEHYYPASLRALSEINISAWYAKSASWFGFDATRVIVMANQRNTVAVMPENGYTLWDLDVEVADPFDTFRDESVDYEFYYVNLADLMRFFGGEFDPPEETFDGNYHIRIPQVQKGSWFWTCELRGFTLDYGRLEHCPIDYWVPGSTWQYYFDLEGDPGRSVNVVREKIVWWKLGPGTDMKHFRMSVIPELASTGLVYESTNFQSFWEPMNQFADELALAGLGLAGETLGQAYQNQVTRNPARTLTMSKITLESIKGLIQDAKMRIMVIRDYILEGGLNVITLPSGQTIKLLVNAGIGELTPEITNAFYMRAMSPQNFEGYFWQSVITGAPEALKVHIDGKDYTLVIEYYSVGPDGRGKWEDGYGDVILPDEEWADLGGESRVTVEVKSGMSSWVDPETGEFDWFLDRVNQNVPKWVDDFQMSIARAQARGEGHMMVFTNKTTMEAFKKVVIQELGEEFFNQHGWRIVNKTKAVINPAFPVK